MKLALCLLLATGCSAGLRGPDPKAAVGVEPDCDETGGGRMAADFIGGTATAAAGIFAGQLSCSGDGARCDHPSARSVGLALLISAPFWLAIHTGSQTTAACRAAWERHRVAH